MKDHTNTPATLQLLAEADMRRLLRDAMELLEVADFKDEENAICAVEVCHQTRVLLDGVKREPASVGEWLRRLATFSEAGEVLYLSGDEMAELRDLASRAEMDERMAATLRKAKGGI